MRNLKAFSCATILCVLLFSCTNYGKLTRRYKELTISKNADSIKFLVGITAFAFEPEKPNAGEPKSIFNLDKKGQEALIEQMGEKTKTTEELAKAISMKFKDEEDEKNIFDLREFKKRVVISVNNFSDYPADRITKLNVTLQLPADAPVSFLYCTKMATEFASVDYGKVNYTNSAGVELNAGLQAPGGSATANQFDGANMISSLVKTLSATNGVNGKLSGSRSFAEEVLLKQRFVAISAFTNGKDLTFLQDGINGIDLTGNIVSEIGIDLGKAAGRFTTRIAYKLGNFKKADTYNAGDSLKVTKSFFLMPDFNGDIKVKLSYTASYRKVIANDRTITEADDKVWLYKGKVDNIDSPVLIKEKDFKPNFWAISIQGVAASYCKIKLRGEADDNSGILLFKDYQSAKDCWDWLTNSPDIPGNEISVQKKEFGIFFPGKPKIQDVRKKLMVTLYQ